MTGVILSGGESKRMGTNKAFIEVNGERIIDRTVRLFKELFDDVMIVTNAPRDYLYLDVRLVTDIVRDKGALGGLYTGLYLSPSPKAFVVSCDMPFLRADVVAYFMHIAESADIVVYRENDYWEPLHAVYSRNLLKHFERLMQQGKLKIIEAYQYMRRREVKKEEVEQFDPELHSMININTPEELKNIQCWGD